jgi:hypothetical protein
MLSILAGILGSSGFGSLIGWLGGAANRWIDLKNRDKDIAVLQMQQAHELAKLDKDREFMRLLHDTSTLPHSIAKLATK